MKNLSLFLFLLAICITSCNDGDIVEGFTKVELQEPLKCTTSNRPKETVNKRLGTVVIHKNKDGLIPVFAYLEDKDGLYTACSLPEEYWKDGLIVMFSGTIYYPDPAAFTYNPLQGLDFEITDLWVNNK